MFFVIILSILLIFIILHRIPKWFGSDTFYDKRYSRREQYDLIDYLLFLILGFGAFLLVPVNFMLGSKILSFSTGVLYEFIKPLESSVDNNQKRDWSSSKEQVQEEEIQEIVSFYFKYCKDNGGCKIDKESYHSEHY